jgi:plasmid segregation protein ParM
MKNDVKLSKIDEIFSIHGLDIGHATLVSETGIILDSKITTVEPLTKADKLTYNDKSLWLGIGKYDSEYNKVKKINYLDFLFGLLALTTNTMHNKICVGLPLSQYREYWEELRQLILKNNTRVLTINGVEKVIIIDDVYVAPEGVVSVKDNYDGIIVDIGGRTTDAALIVTEFGKRKIKRPISIPLGTIDLYTDLINKVNSKHGLNLDIDYAPRILKDGLTIKGKKENIDFALEMYKEFTSTLIAIYKTIIP